MVQSGVKDAPTTLAAYVASLVTWAEQQGADRQQLLRSAGMQESQLADPAGRIPVPQFLDLLSAAASQLNDPFVGISWGKSMKPGGLGAMGYITMSCTHLRDVVQLIPRYEALIYEQAVTRLSEAGDRVTLDWTIGLPDSGRHQAMNDVVITVWIEFGRWISGLAQNPLEVCFRHARPDTVQPYLECFGVEPRFDQPRNAVVFERAVLDIPVIQADPIFHRMVRQQGETQLQALEAGRSTAGQVREVLQQSLPQGECTVAEVAHRLHLGERTLRRRLEQENTSYKAVLMEFRQSLARYYLAQPGMELIDVAFLLGYSEYSSFSKAFKEWVGESPSDFRQRHQPAGE